MIKNELRKSICAGFLMGLSEYISLMCDNKYLSAFLFAIGLYTICIYELNLFTGMIGYISLYSDRTFATKVLLTLYGNIIGCLMMAMFPVGEQTQSILDNIITDKDIYTALYKSFLCGCLMFIAVDTYKKKNNIIGIFLCVPAFILSGMEHSIANTYYILLYDICNMTLKNLPYVIVCIIGNSMGAIFMRKLICM